MSLTPEQQEEYQKLQQMAQQLSQLQQNYSQYQYRQLEMEKSIEVLSAVDEDQQIFQRVGKIMVSKKAGDVLSSLKDELELFEVRVSKSKKQVEQTEKMLKDAEARFRQFLAS